MNMKKYQKPAMTVETFETENFFCFSVQNISSQETGITYGGGSNEEARSRSIDSWTMEDE